MAKKQKQTKKHTRGHLRADFGIKEILELFAVRRIFRCHCILCVREREKEGVCVCVCVCACVHLCMCVRQRVCCVKSLQKRND